MGLDLRSYYILILVSLFAALFSYLSLMNYFHFLYTAFCRFLRLGVLACLESGTSIDLIPTAPFLLIDHRDGSIPACLLNNPGHALFDMQGMLTTSMIYIQLPTLLDATFLFQSSSNSLWAIDIVLYYIPPEIVIGIAPLEHYWVHASKYYLTIPTKWQWQRKESHTGTLPLDPSISIALACQPLQGNLVGVCFSFHFSLDCISACFLAIL